ncbi:MAG: hypothetical protein ACF8OB_00350 [Phycisphaeraceae bacterium JB051]
MPINRLFIMFLSLTLCFTSMYAQDEPQPKVDTRAMHPAAVNESDPKPKLDIKETVNDELKLITSVVQVMDRRSSIQSILNQCMVELLFIGKPLELVIGVDRVQLTEAIDDKGNDLIKQKSQPNRNIGQDDLLSSAGGKPTNAAGMTIKLKNPPREAKQIQSIKGIAHFILKSVEGKDYVHLSDFMNETGKPIPAEALKNRKVQITYLPPQWIKDWAAEKNTEKTSIIPDAEMSGLLPLIEGISKQSGNVKLIPLLIMDPDKQIARVQITSKAGPLRQIQFDHVTVYVSLQGEPENAMLEVNLKSDDNTLSLPFEIGEIPLP